MNTDSIDYLSEKIAVAVDCLCGGDGRFEERLWDAHVSSLHGLDQHPLPPDVAEDLGFVLRVCNEHAQLEEKAMSPVGESDRLEVAKRLVRLLVAASPTAPEVRA
jgi:hypothetical protein